MILAAVSTSLNWNDSVSRTQHALLRCVRFRPKGKKVVVLGGGLTGLVAAWDLAKKGIVATLIDPAPYDIISDAIPESAMTAHHEAMAKIGVQFEQTTPDPDATFYLENWDAVIVASATYTEQNSIFSQNKQTLQTNNPNIFSASSAPLTSTVDQLATGRKLALSTERFVQKGISHSRPGIRGEL